MLSAQPVVPLEQVRSSKARAAFARPWILGLSLAAALLLGVFATALYYSRASEDNARVFEGIEVTSGAVGSSGESVHGFSENALEEPKVETNKPAPASPAAEVRQTVRVTNDSDKKPQPRLVAVIKERKNSHTQDRESLKDQKAARRQARRERRRADRERQGGNSSDDLLRIRDIFEGSPRP